MIWINENQFVDASTGTLWTELPLRTAYAEALFDVDSREYYSLYDPDLTEGEYLFSDDVPSWDVWDELEAQEMFLMSLPMTYCSDPSMIGLPLGCWG